MTSIGDYAFAYCSALTQVTIPGSVESIGYAAFALCSALAEINVLATVPPTITAYTFSNINPQVKVSIPEGSKEAYMADENWKWLLDLSAGQLSGTCGDNLTWTFTTADSTLTISGTGDMYDYSYDYSSDRPWYNFRQGIKNISIQDGVESIGSYAFYSCSSLTKVTIGNSVESIGDYAFDYCSALAEITVLPTVPPTITANTFSNINPQVKVSIPEGSKDAYMADENWKQLLDLSAGELSGICGDNLTWTFTTADSTLTISGTGNMYDYYSSNQPWYNFRQGIKNISIQDGVESIGNYAFYSCSSLTKVTIGNSVKSIGYEAFALCSALKQVNIGDGVTSIGSSAFYGCSALTQVTIPGSVTSIGDEAFYGCSALTQVTWNAINCADFSNGPFNDSRSNIKVFIFGNQVEHIPAFLCYGMDKLTQVNIPDGVTSIGGGAFLRCSALTQVNIPDGVTSIENLTFQECLALTQINIPDGVTSIGDQAFCYCSALTQVTISDGVESIGDQAFYGCSALTQVTIPDGVTSIGESAYLDCSALTQVNIPDGVESIGEYAFSRCSALTQVNIGDGVTSIGDYAFAYCSALTQVTIGNSVTSIGNWAFSNCSALAEMTVLATVPPTVESSAFYEVSRDIPVYVPAEALEDYRVASVWREFNLQAMQTALQTPSMPESIRVYGGMLHNPQGLPVSIYDMQGRMVYSGTAATVSQPAGVYVVLCAGASSKVLF